MTLAYCHNISIVTYGGENVHQTIFVKSPKIAVYGLPLFCYNTNMKKISAFNINIKDAIAPTAVAVIIMLTTMWLFGMVNSMIAPFATLSYMRFLQMRCHYPCMLKHYLIYLLIIAAAFVATLSPATCVLADFGIFFILAYIVVDEYDPINYFPFGMAMIFFQFAPVENVSGMLFRMLALTFSFGIILVFVLITAPLKIGRDPLREYIEEGFSICETLLADCRAGNRDAVVADHLALREINKKCSDEIYVYNRTAIGKRGMVNYYSRFVIVFQVVNYLTHSPKEQKPDDPALLKAERLIRRFRFTLENEKPEPKYWTFRFRSGKIDVWDFRFRFAMRQVLVMVPCILFAQMSGFPNISWLPFSLFFMLVPSSDDTPSLVRNRFFGSFFGIVICLILFALFPSLEARVIMTAIFSFLIYSAKSLVASVAYVTCATLAMQTLNMDPITAMWQCLLYTAIGAVIALLCNHYLFPIHTDVQIRRLQEKLYGIRLRMVELGIPPEIRKLVDASRAQESVEASLSGTAASNPDLSGNLTAGGDVSGAAGAASGAAADTTSSGAASGMSSLAAAATAAASGEVIRTPLSRRAEKNMTPDEQRRHELDQLAIHSYLIARRIEILDQSRPPEKRDSEALLEMEKKHMRFMAEMLLYISSEQDPEIDS